jgi:hypothetical protein
MKELSEADLVVAFGALEERECGLIERTGDEK